MFSCILWIFCPFVHCTLREFLFYCPRDAVKSTQMLPLASLDQNSAIPWVYDEYAVPISICYAIRNVLTDGKSTIWDHWKRDTRHCNIVSRNQTTGRKKAVWLRKTSWQLVACTQTYKIPGLWIEALHKRHFQAGTPTKFFTDDSLLVYLWSNFSFQKLYTSIQYLFNCTFCWQLIKSVNHQRALLSALLRLRFQIPRSTHVTKGNPRRKARSSVLIK